MENKNLDEQRIAKCMVSCDVLTQLFTGQTYSTDAPEDLKVVAVEQTATDYFNGTFQVYFTSKENAIVPEGEDPPKMEKSFMFTRKTNVKSD